MWGRASSTILIVSETAPNHELNTTFLRQPDIRILTCDQDDAVVETVACERPTLVVEDLQERTLEGLALCRRLKSGAETHSTPLILVMNPQHRAEAERAGPDGLVLKPVVPEKFFTAVGRFVRLPRRRAARYKINLRFTYPVDGRTYQVFSREVSINGAFLKTDRPMEYGTHFDVSFSLPGTPRVICCGAVVKTVIENRGYHNNGIGVEFEGIRDEDLASLERYLRERRRMSLFE